MAGLWDVLVGASQGVSGQLEKQQEQRMKLQQLREAAQAEAQAKFQYSPEAQAQNQAIAQIQKLFPIPSAQEAPTIRLAPGVASTPGGQDMMQKFQAAHQAYQGKQQEAVKNRLEAMQQFGLLKMNFNPLQFMSGAGGMSGVGGGQSGQPNMGNQVAGLVGGGQQGAAPSGFNIPSVTYRGVTFTNPDVVAANKAKETAATTTATSQATLLQGATEFGKHAQDIQDAVAAVKTMPSMNIGGAEVNPLNPIIGGLRHQAGAMDETFANATAAINRSITQFVKGIEGIPGARININEIKYLTDSIQQLPYLSPTGRQKRYQELNALLQEKGVPSQYWFQVASPESESAKERLRTKYAR